MMPTNFIKKLSDEGKGSIQSLEKKWNLAKSLAKESGHEEFDYITGVFKKMIKESFSVKSLINELHKDTLKSYIKKAVDPNSEKSISNLASRGGYEHAKNHDGYSLDDGEEYDRKSFIRSKGVMRAIDKISKKNESLKVGDEVYSDYPDEKDIKCHVTYIHSSGKVKLADDKGKTLPNYRNPENIKRRNIHENQNGHHKTYSLKNWKDGDKENLDESKKKIGEYSHGSNVSKVYKLTGEHNEGDPYVVHLHKNGKHYEPADYFTNDEEDAHSTAKHMVKESENLIGGVNHKAELIEESKDVKSVVKYVVKNLVRTITNPVKQANHELDSEEKDKFWLKDIKSKKE